MPKRLAAVFLSIMSVVSLTGMSYAINEVGSVIAVKNTAVIERENKHIGVKAKDGILLVDTVATMEGSRAKMLFSNDSVVTLGENSRLVIEEYVYSEGKRGKSVFNLIEGKMRTVVGKTDLEIHTPSAVAAARGTIILTETSVINGIRVTSIVCIEGIVEVTSLDVSVPGSVQLQPGMMTILSEGGSPAQPETASAELLSRLSGETNTGYIEITVPEPVEAGVGLVTALDTQTGAPEITPPLDQQPAGEVSPVTVNILFP